MLHVQFKDDATHVSLHHMFIKAPQSVQDGLATYIRSESAALLPSVQAFIDKNVQRLDDSHLLDGLETRGTVYNLQRLYNKINRRYFASGLDLVITWFGEPHPKARTKCTIGSYHESVKLVKIHRLLDTQQVPQYVIEYVIYHEMVHAACPPYVDARGKNCIHTKEFKELERKFEQFDEAQKWLSTHHKNFFVL